MDQASWRGDADRKCLRPYRLDRRHWHVLNPMNAPAAAPRANTVAAAPAPLAASFSNLSCATFASGAAAPAPMTAPSHVRRARRQVRFIVDCRLEEARSGGVDTAEEVNRGSKAGSAGTVSPPNFS